MIIRRGISVKYSHDEEALVAALMEMREFAGVSAATLAEWIEPLRPYGCNADYITVREDDGCFYTFRPASEIIWVRPDDRRHIVKVTLWRLEDTARQLIEDHGFSCLACRANTPWKDRPEYWRVEATLRHRAHYILPTLVCPKCTEFVSRVFVYPYVPGIDLAVEKIVQHFKGLAA